jgi:DNA-binding response OmpR family regulator
MQQRSFGDQSTCKQARRRVVKARLRATRWSSVMKPELARSLARIRVGSFELNLHTGELRSADATVLLREQPFQVLRRVHAVFGEALHEEQMSREIESLDH